MCLLRTRVSSVAVRSGNTPSTLKDLCHAEQPPDDCLVGKKPK
jgi:hypothetical protein